MSFLIAAEISGCTCNRMDNSLAKVMGRLRHPTAATMRTKMIVGVLELTSKYRYGLNSRGAPLYLFRPYDETRPEYVVASSTRDTSSDQIVIVDVPSAETPVPGPGQPRLRGMLARILGPVGDVTAEIWGLLNHYAGCLRSVKLPPTPEPDTRDDGIRQELSAATGWVSWHVDPPGCRDVDDAFSWHADTNTWAITIADAAAAVPAVSELEDRARSIGATFYNLDGKVVRAMLNPEISEETASLQREQRRRGLSLMIPPSPADPYFTLTWITVDHTFTYEAWPTSPLARQLHLHEEDAHAFVERQMILYNRRAADLFRQFPAAGGLVRTQAATEFEVVREWATIDPALAHLANEAATYEFATTDHDQSHSGLNTNAYTHITSPLRRYADLHNQRVLKAILRDGPDAHPPSCMDAGLPAHLNERTKAQRRWTRDITFLEHVTPGLIHEIDVIWVDATRVWVPVWKRLLRLRHDPQDIPPPGTKGRIEIFCDPTRRNWRQRVLTAPLS